jgi:nucleotidyltransferase AbiEii toxin of type IV toxin-antitoxin system
VNLSIKESAVADWEPGTWHSNVISGSTVAALESLRDTGVLNGFYLAGGTGLALRFGHRLSLDLDFFGAEHFNEDALLQELQNTRGFALAAKAPYTLHASVEGTKVSFLGFAYPVLFPTDSFLHVSVADPRDIACMKLSAIASRGAKRDFIDLYVCAERFGIEQIMSDFEHKYARVNLSRIHLLKSLTYFADAEKDPMPHMLAPLAWDEVKRFFNEQAPKLLR